MLVGGSRARRGRRPGEHTDCRAGAGRGENVAGGALPIDAAPVRNAALALIFPLLAACGGDRPGADAGAAPGEAGSAPAVWSRDASAPALAGSGASDPPVLATVDPAALDELLANAPKAAPPQATGDGGTAIGTDTGLPASSAEAPAAKPTAAPNGSVTFGKAMTQTEMSSPAIERAARAQLYWRLVQKCRDREGKILPPESVRLLFKVDADGYIASSTIIAEGKSERFTEAARCMARELSTATFRAPASARGQPHTVNADVPSVD